MGSERSQRGPISPGRPFKRLGFYCRRVGLSLKSFEQRCNLV